MTKIKDRYQGKIRSRGTIKIINKMFKIIKEEDVYAQGQ
ncbi:hypothetical protein LCGC14_2050190 [marine sediment metagenome]|uniref:Uncharacterized protein n=1 Tax=marine sediment metagenome TaxID=412755 RepID=A0A0F9EP85_9ZZZZ